METGRVIVNTNPLTFVVVVTGNEVVQVEETRGSRIFELSAPWRIGNLRGGGEAAGRALPWSPWLSAEHNPSLIKGECRGDT